MKARLLFHLAHKSGDESALLLYHKNLHDVIEDQLSLASLHYLRSHYQDAIDIYKGVLAENRQVDRIMNTIHNLKYYFIYIIK